MKKIRILAVFLVIFLVVLLTPVQAQMIWKDTEISRFVPMPRNVKITPPDASVPPETAAFSGRWEGIWQDTLPPQEAIIVVEKINGSQANIVYGSGKGRTQKADWTRMKAKIIDGRLEFVTAYSTYVFTLKNNVLSGVCETKYRSFSIEMHKIE